MIAIIVVLFAIQPSWSCNFLDMAERSRIFFTSHKEDIQKKAPHACHDYYRTLVYLGFSIKTADSVAKKNSLEELLFGMLHTGGHWGWSATQVADAESTNIFGRIAYGAFIARSDFEPQEGSMTTSMLKKCKDDATPRQLGDNVSYIYCPELQSWMVLERLSEQSRDWWKEYSRECDVITSVRYVSRDSRYKHLKESVYGFIRETLDPQHYISYLTRYDPKTFYPFSGTVQADKIGMLATVHADENQGIYTPFGITRTFEEAGRRVAYEKEHNMDLPKPSQPESVFFHALLARLVAHKFANVKNFWTVPLPPMQTILLQATHPDIVVLMGKPMGEVRNKDAVFPFVKQKQRIQVGGALPEGPWVKRIHEFSPDEELRTTIPVQVMVRLLYPHV